MALTPGTRLGAYEILSSLGSGGMGEVYRARDTKHNRDVAIKVFPNPSRPTLRGSPASSGKPRSSPRSIIRTSSESTGWKSRTAFVRCCLELVQGPTLADRISRGPIPIDEALPIARQIAEGLGDAHESGVIHRDLKPANIKVTSDGKVKVLDFRLAKLTSRRPATGPPRPFRRRSTRARCLARCAWMRCSSDRDWRSVEARE
jgi:eukaryotic-like serine/threonine-protein kinase